MSPDVTITISTAGDGTVSTGAPGPNPTDVAHAERLDAAPRGPIPTPLDQLPKAVSGALGDASTGDSGPPAPMEIANLAASAANAGGQAPPADGPRSARAGRPVIREAQARGAQARGAEAEVARAPGKIGPSRADLRERPVEPGLPGRRRRFHVHAVAEEVMARVGEARGDLESIEAVGLPGSRGGSARRSPPRPSIGRDALCLEPDRVALVGAVRDTHRGMQCRHRPVPIDVRSATPSRASPAGRGNG